MPRQDWQQNTNRGRKALPELLPVDTICVKTYVPNDYQYVGLFIGSLNRLAMQSIYDRDVTKKAKEVASLWRLANQLTFESLAGGCGGDVIGGGGGGGVNLPACITTESAGDEFIINIEECCEMTVIINIKDCCCGDGGGGGGGSGVSSGYDSPNITGGGSFGNDLGLAAGGGVSASNAITQCDFITTVIPLILEQMKELLTTIDNANANLEDALEAAEEASDAGSIAQDAFAFIGELINLILEAGSGAVLAMLLDNDFEFRLQEAWIKAHGTAGSITTVTWNDLNAMSKYLPLTWIEAGAIIFPRILMPLLFRVINLGKTNSRLIIAKGTAQTGLCEYIYAGAGVEYIAPPNQLALPVPGLEFAYEWGRRYDFLVGTQGFVSSGDGAWTEGLGWTGSGGPATDYRVIIDKAFTCQVTGVRIGLDRSMQGNKNDVDIGTGHGGGQIVDDFDATAVNPIVVPLDVAFNGTISFRCTENEYANNTDDNFTAYWQYLDIFGTGTPPSGGEEI